MSMDVNDVNDMEIEQYHTCPDPMEWTGLYRSGRKVWNRVHNRRMTQHAVIND